MSFANNQNPNGFSNDNPFANPPAQQSFATPQHQHPPAQQSFATPQHQHPPAAQPPSPPSPAFQTAGQPPPSPAPAAPAAPAFDPYAGFDAAEVMGQRDLKVHEHLGVFTGDIVSVQDGVCTGKSKGKPFFGATMIVAESSNPDIPVGCTINWSSVFYPPNPEYHASNIKGFLGAVLSILPEAVTVDIKDKALHESQPARGRRVRWEVYVNQKGKRRTRFYPAQQS